MVLGCWRVIALLILGLCLLILDSVRGFFTFAGGEKGQSFIVVLVHQPVNLGHMRVRNKVLSNEETLALNLSFAWAGTRFTRIRHARAHIGRLEEGSMGILSIIKKLGNATGHE